MLLPVFHAFVLAVNFYSLWYDQMFVNFPFATRSKTDEMPLKGRLMYFTIWSLILQTSYFLLSLLNDLVGSNEVSPRRAPFIRKIKDLVFSICFPASIYVSITFWGIYNLNKELIFPEALAKVFPDWLNHTMHTTVSLFILMELLLTKRSYPSRKVGITLSVVYNFSYIIWMHIIHDRIGAWPYPIFDVLSLPGRVAFLSVAMGLGIGLYILAEKLSGLVSSAPKKRSAEPKKKRK